jgi:hypothetical protein
VVDDVCEGRESGGDLQREVGVNKVVEAWEEDA